jgi:hypothetical protein
MDIAHSLEAIGRSSIVCNFGVEIDLANRASLPGSAVLAAGHAMRGGDRTELCYEVDGASRRWYGRVVFFGWRRDK